MGNRQKIKELELRIKALELEIQILKLSKPVVIPQPYPIYPEPIYPQPTYPQPIYPQPWQPYNPLTPWITYLSAENSN